MATIDEHLEYLKDSGRFPKINKKEIKDPTSQLSSTEYNQVIDILEELVKSRTPKDPVRFETNLDDGCVYFDAQDEERSFKVGDDGNLYVIDYN